MIDEDDIQYDEKQRRYVPKAVEAVPSSEPSPVKPVRNFVPSFHGNNNQLMYILIVAGLVLIAVVIGFKSFTVSGTACPEVNCGNYTVTYPVIPPCPSFNFTTPNLTCPTHICSPILNTTCYSYATYNQTCPNCTQFNYTNNNINLGIRFYNGLYQNGTMTFVGNGTYIYSYFNLTESINYTFEVKING